MRFLADENFPGDAVVALRAAGHDVVWVHTDVAGSTDVDVLASAQHEKRVLLTFDKDFGELAWRYRLPANCGIVLFRLEMPSPTMVGESLVTILSSRHDWTGHFAVIEAGRIRLRRLPESQAE